MQNVDFLAYISVYDRLPGHTSSSYFKFILQDQTSSSFFKFILQVQTSGSNFKIKLQDQTSSSYFKFILQVQTSRSNFKFILQVHTSSSFFPQFVFGGPVSYGDVHYVSVNRSRSLVFVQLNDTTSNFTLTSQVRKFVARNFQI